MGRLILLAILVCPCLLGSDLKEGWDVVLSQSQFEYQDETFTLLSIRPVNIAKLVEQTPPHQRKRLIQQLWLDRRNANQLLHVIKDFIFHWSASRGMVDGDQKEKLRSHFQKLLTGRFPFTLVTEYNNPFRIHQLFGMGLDEGFGIPLETRLVGRGMEKLTRPVRTLSPIPICYVPPRGKPECHREISDLLSKIPRLHGDIAELRSLTKDPNSPYDFTEVLYYKAISEGWMYWGGTPIAPDERPEPLQGALRDEAMKLSHKYPDIPPTLLFPEFQENLYIDDFYSHTLTESRARLYATKFGMQRALSLFPDPDYPGKLAHVLKVSSETLGSLTPRLLAKAASHALVESGRVADNFLPTFACSLLIEREDLAAYPSFRPQSYRPQLILSGAEIWIVPPESYIDKIARKLVPEWFTQETEDVPD